MRIKTIFGLATAALVLFFAAGASTQGILTPQQELGQRLFFDTSLSTPAGQACAACHGPAVGYTGPNAAINAAGAVYEGAIRIRRA